nr:relaxase/mobilization nuclease domain-containing protein [Enterococcus faecium]
MNRGKNFTYELIPQKKKVRSNKLGKDYEKETILHELDRRERAYNQQRTNELRRARASIRETAQKKYEENNELLPTEQPEIRPTRRNHDQHVERGADYQQELSF